MTPDPKIPRCWTLEASFDGTIEQIEQGPALQHGERCDVIEADPVLDLLEQWMPRGAIGGGPLSQLTLATHALLTAHGRLQ